MIAEAEREATKEEEEWFFATSGLGVEDLAEVKVVEGNKEASSRS